MEHGQDVVHTHNPSVGLLRVGFSLLSAYLSIASVSQFLSLIASLAAIFSALMAGRYYYFEEKRKHTKKKA